MPKRNNEQKIKHNEARRSFVKHGKKAMFCIEHIKAKHPDIVKEASDIYEYLVYLYPSKRNLMKTEVYLKQYTPVQNTVVQHTAVQNTAVQNPVVQHTAVQNTAVQNTVVQHTAVQNTAVQNTAVPRHHKKGCRTADRNSTHQNPTTRGGHYPASTDRQ